jgi:DNA-binding CsgD family transcriptional regulator
VEQHLFDSAVASLYETVLDPEQWNVAIADVARFFAAPTATMFSYDFTSNRAYGWRAHGFDPDVGQRYTSYYCQLDPGRSTAMAARVGEWVADEVLLDVRSPHHQEYVHDFALPSGIGRVGGVKVAGDATTCTWLSLERRPGAERFGEAARRQYREIEPHLRRVIQMQTRLDTLAVGNALARACLDRLQAGVVVVDRSRRVHYVNAHGTRLLGRGHDLALSQRRLRCSRPPLDEQLGRLVQDACAQLARGGALRIPHDSDRQSLLLSILPVPRNHELAALVPEPLALVVIGESGNDNVPIDVYRALFSLSYAEAALMAALVRGSSVADWARERHISVATVRTQLRSLFEKTGVDTQARLVGLARAVPPLS